MEDFELVSIGEGARIDSKVLAVSVSRGVQDWGHVTIGARAHVCGSSTVGAGAVVGDDVIIHIGTYAGRRVAQGWGSIHLAPLTPLTHPWQVQLHYSSTCMGHSTSESMPSTNGPL